MISYIHMKHLSIRRFLFHIGKVVGKVVYFSHTRDRGSYAIYMQPNQLKRYDQKVY